MPLAARLVASGEIDVPIVATYPMAEVAAAMAHVRRGGKVILKIAD